MKTIAPCLLALALLAPGVVFGQAVYGSISGNVTDSTGASVPGAKVTITDTGKGINYSTVSNESGNYTQGHLIVGIYDVRVEAQGFAAYTQKNVHVEVDAVTSINARLALGSVGETVNVTGEAPLLKTQRSDVSDTVTQRAVAELPVFGRDMSRLYFLIPGVQATGTTAASENPQDIYRPTIGGQYWGGINFQLDGTDNRDSVLGEPVITPNLDWVSELKITTTGYDAEFGQASQAISAHTKSGTNELHGSVRVPARPSQCRTRSLCAVAADSGHQRTIYLPLCGTSSAALSAGPIQKDKTFYFRRLSGPPPEKRRVAAHPRADGGGTGR